MRGPNKLISTTRAARFHRAECPTQRRLRSLTGAPARDSRGRPAGDVQNGTAALDPLQVSCVTQESNVTETALPNADLRPNSASADELQTDVQRRIRDGRSDRPAEVRDDLAHSD